MVFPGTHYYRTDYSQTTAYNCIVSIASRASFSRGQYSPLDLYLRLSKDMGNSGRSIPDHSEGFGNGASSVSEKNKSGFTDVPEQAYYCDAIRWAAENKITEGTDATHFSPDTFCTRAQAVTFLWRAAVSPTPGTVQMPFTDVSANSYCYDAVLWAVENGITEGTSATTFSPDACCTRAQTVTFLNCWMNGSSAV